MNEPLILAFLVFTRIGALLMSLPGIGAAFIPATARLGAAVPLTIILYPSVEGVTVPLTISELVLAVASEVVLGVAMGYSVQLVFSVLSTAFETIGLQAGLGMATLLDPITGSQPSVLGVFAIWLATGLFFGTDLHLVCIDAMARSLTTVPPAHTGDVIARAGVLIPLADATFRAGAQLAGPLVIFTFVVHLAQALLARMAPNMQLFWAIGPILSVGLGLVVLAATMPTLLGAWYAMMPRALHAIAVLSGAGR